MYEMEDKVAEDFILSARKHLFMANNLFAMFMFIKDRKRDVGAEAGNLLSNADPVWWTSDLSLNETASFNFLPIFLKNA